MNTDANLLKKFELSSRNSLKKVCFNRKMVFRKRTNYVLNILFFVCTIWMGLKF